MSKRVDKLLNITVGDLREKLAYADSDDLVKDWLYDQDDFEEVDTDYDEVEDEDYEDEEEDDYWDNDDDEVGSTSLPSEEEERLAMDIADDIDEGKYTIDTIRSMYSQELVARVEYLID